MGTGASTTTTVNKKYNVKRSSTPVADVQQALKRSHAIDFELQKSKAIDTKTVKLLLLGNILENCLASL